MCGWRGFRHVVEGNTEDVRAVFFSSLKSFVVSPVVAFEAVSALYREAGHMHIMFDVIHNTRGFK